MRLVKVTCMCGKDGWLCDAELKYKKKRERERLRLFIPSSQML